MTSSVGDDGNARLPHGRFTVPKDDSRLEAVGAIETLSASLGWALTLDPGDFPRVGLERIQSELVDLSIQLAAVPETLPGHTLSLSALEALDELTARLEEQLDPLLHVLIPGGSPAGAALHLARAHCRTAERRLVTLARRYRLPGLYLAYLNRLGSALFLMARVANRVARVEEPRWCRREEREREA